MVDRTTNTGRQNVPWRMAHFVFLHDVVRMPAPPRRMADMVAWASAHPGRLTHPRASDVLGVTFLMQALLELAPDRAALAQPAGDATYAAAASPLWRWYAALRPHLWHGGRDCPATGPEQIALFAAGELDVALSFNPAEAANGIAHGVLPTTTRAFVPAGGTLGHCSFVAIPEGAPHRAGAMVLADFLLSPEAQAHAADPRILGSPTVLDLARLSLADRALFQAPADVPGLLTAAALATPLPEPHPSWMVRVAAEWERVVLG